MEPLIHVISKLQDVFAAVGDCGFQLPQIVVVGSQSSGKSSVLEGIIGRDFLPRGTGIVTRRPLFLHLIHTPIEDPIRQQAVKKIENDWAVFSHKPNDVFTDFELVRKEIEEETTRLTGTNKGVSAIPISLKIFSDRVLNLSLIDLPGITKVPVGDQPADIELQIRQMIFTYISNPNSIILAVTPANQDFATSEPLKLARDVDKDGKRTLAVLTKLDLMDQGTDAADVLTGKLVPVKLGIIGVVNRSQADIIAKKSIKECLMDEAKFLARKYPTLVAVNGTKYLSMRLNRLLLQHIRDCLPQLKARISKMTLQYRSQIQSYGMPVVDKRGTLLQIINKFSTAYTSTIEGTSKSDIETLHLCGGARICYIFHEMFGHTLEKINPMDGLTTTEIKVAIRNTTGPRPVLFLPEASFELLVKRQIRCLEEPSLQCVDLVYEELLSIVQNCGFKIQQEMQRFPQLSERINEVVSQVLSSRLEPTKVFVSNLIEIQLAYINTSHPEFIDLALKYLNLSLEPLIVANTLEVEVKPSGDDGIASKPNATQPEPPKNGSIEEDKRLPSNASTNGIRSGWWFRSNNPNDHSQAQDGAISNGAEAGAQNSTTSLNSTTSFNYENSQTKGMASRERWHVSIIEKLIREYFLIVRKTVQDLVPKAIMKFLVNQVKENLQNELISRLYNADDIEQIISESELMIQKRKEVTQSLNTLTKANTILCEIREANI